MLFVIDNVALHVHYCLSPSSIIYTIFVWLLSLMLLVVLRLVRCTLALYGKRNRSLVLYSSYTISFLPPAPEQCVTNFEKCTKPWRPILAQHMTYVVTRETSPILTIRPSSKSGYGFAAYVYAYAVHFPPRITTLISSPYYNGTRAAKKRKHTGHRLRGASNSQTCSHESRCEPQPDKERATT